MKFKTSTPDPAVFFNSLNLPKFSSSSLFVCHLLVAFSLCFATNLALAYADPESINHDERASETEANIPSPFRYARESAEHAARRELRKTRNFYRHTHQREGDVYSSRELISAMDPTRIAPWPETQSLQSAFESIRNERFLVDDNHPDFLRRISWLYPDDGCYVRAELMSEKLQTLGFPAPTKLFVFGELVAKTRFSPEGEVRWWYHVVVAYRLRDYIMVFDPAVHSTGPLAMTDWLSRIGAGSDSTASICDAAAVSPNSTCMGATASTPEATAQTEAHFLRSEWRRMNELELIPENVLGEMPPWLPNQASFFSPFKISPLAIQHRAVELNY